NPTLLTQVITNLLSNALKFVARGVRPRVEVAIKEAGRQVRVEVRDNGIGIAPEYQEKVFRMFERLHTTAEYPGTGIGLAIVQKAMLRMGGKLGLESTPGQGSCFWIELARA
ncbi:MAG TPA: ATP-binding protein, partial [Bacillota bacterium]|nr:ATP-binding protein [Bacillota bacterium]